MKKIILAIIIGGVAALAWVLWFKPAKHEAEEAKAETVVSVQVGQVQRATLQARVEAYGTVEAEPAGGGKPAGAARLSAPTASLVLTVPVKEGDRVKAGAVVVKLDDRMALAQLRQAEQQMARQNKLKTSGGTSEKALQEAAQQLAIAQAQLAQVQLVTPLAGVVARIHVQPGQTVEPNAVIAEVIDPDRLVVTVSVPSGEAAALKIGQPAELLAERTATATQGQVLFVSPQVDAQTDTTLVRISVPPASGLRPGQFVHTRIITADRANILAVPREAVYTDHDGRSTLSIVQGDVAKQKTVKVGLRDGNLVEVEGDGVVEGVTVVTLGSYALPEETKIQVLKQAPTEKPAAGVALLELKQTIPLPDVKGGFDLMAADVAGQRLFVNAEDNNTTEVIDLAANKRIHTITGMHEPKWVVYRPESYKLYVANGDGTVRVLDSESFAPVGSITFKEKANNLRFDPQTHELFVGVGKTFGAIGVVDTRSNAITAQIPLANFPKQFELDGDRIYVNVPTANHVAVIDRTKQAVVATWPIAAAKDNVPMALDRANHRLFIGCEPGKFVVLDTATGQPVATLNISPEPDGIAYDAARQLIYISCGAGFIDVLRQVTADQYELAERIPTAKGAATSLFIPEWRKLILAVPQRDQQTAELRVFQAGS